MKKNVFTRIISIKLTVDNIKKKEIGVAKVSKNQIIDNNSLSHIIAEKITEQIITGTLQPGEKIVETVYAEEFGTSRAPVREALYLLTIEGLVERIPRKGAVVKGYSEAEIRNLLEIRMLLESLAMKRIAENGVETELLQVMIDLLQEMKRNKEDIEAYALLNQKFHNCIISMGESEIIKNMYARLGRPLLSLQRISFLGERNIDKSVQEHQEIVKKLEENEIAAATEILVRHNEESMKRIEVHLKDNLVTSG